MVLVGGLIQAVKIGGMFGVVPESAELHIMLMKKCDDSSVAVDNSVLPRHAAYRIARCYFAVGAKHGIVKRVEVEGTPSGMFRCLTIFGMTNKIGPIYRCIIGRHGAVVVPPELHYGPDLLNG